MVKLTNVLKNKVTNEEKEETGQADSNVEGQEEEAAASDSVNK